MGELGIMYTVQKYTVKIVGIKRRFFHKESGCSPDNACVLAR
jgi:hypothetical protein